MSQLDLGDRRALVTGGAGGIGAAVSRRLAAAGATVVVADSNGAGATALAADIGGEAWPVDLSDTTALSTATLDVDVLVNNAGVQHVSRLEEFPPERFSAIVRLMLEAPFLLVRAVLPKMYERGWGRIVNISSALGDGAARGGVPVQDRPRLSDHRLRRGRVRTRPSRHGADGAQVGEVEHRGIRHDRVVGAADPPDRWLRVHLGQVVEPEVARCHVLSTPLAPGAIPGQASTATWSPG